ncbi:SURP and G-patch domain-containing protein 1-like isoform X2 [Toxorhynchites rutilus septentrionalis]|uniref:SURP and G-patch domain-containing protein 1-like isoform X2 n=1 Tax=Toxorhynchites rutilus septentrionalis TaxID=329112 RepID=UPI0024797EEB|nr:SURP and G-patch domain-containing protein 1-like isoform X2 [Toxorhynchites rutilus septentrionalis]
MPRVNFTRTDRIAQMSKQEQLIAQKRQQILEKQRTLQMAKQIVAEANKSNTAATESEPDKSGGLKLPFSNDGSFLENFKKLSEKFVKTEEQNKRAADEEISSSDKKFKSEESILITIPPPPPPPPAPTIPAATPTLPMEVAYAAYYDITQPPPIIPPLQPAPLPPSIPDEGISEQQEAVASVEPNNQRAVVEQVPEVGANCKVFSENDKLPTTVQELVELVADIGDVYEEKLCSRKNELHPSLWFLFDKQSEAYRNYRHMIVARLFKTAGIEHALPASQPVEKIEHSADDAKYDPADVLDDTNMEEDSRVLSQHEQLNQDEPIQMQPNYYGDERHFYDDKSTTETDSDTEYVREARKRNLKNLKRKTMNAGNVREESTTDTEDDFNESSECKQDSQSDRAANASGGSRCGRQKNRKKSRWGDQADGTETHDLVCDSKDDADGSHHSANATTTTDRPSSTCGLQMQHTNSKSNPGFLQFVFQCFGTVEVSPESWKKAEEHFKIRLLYEDMSNKIQTHEKFVSNCLMNGNNGGQPDVDEDRRLNSNKMKAVLLWIDEITQLYERKRLPLEDFLMADEYKGFIAKFQNTSDQQPTFEDYKKVKLDQAKIVSTNSRGEYSSTDSDCNELKYKTALPYAEHDQSISVPNENDKAARRRKSRWGDQVSIQTVQNPAMISTTASTSYSQPSVASTSNCKLPNAPKLSSVNRTDPALLAYVRQNFGTVNLTEEDWKKAEDHYKINLLYQDMLRKRQEIDRLAASGKFKYEYDSDEDTTGGTWEHKLRSQEMEATQLWANELTKKSEGKHHIGDFLPPEELRKFMEKYDAQKNNRQPNLSDYKEYKLKEDNVGFQMLQKLGWKEGQGLGADGSGIVDPINKASQRDNNQGLGVASSENPEVDDNEYDAYRKRMMLAYRFRPNPLNNPRRAYY